RKPRVSPDAGGAGVRQDARLKEAIADLRSRRPAAASGTFASLESVRSRVPSPRFAGCYVNSTALAWDARTRGAHAERGPRVERRGANCPEQPARRVPGGDARDAAAAAKQALQEAERRWTCCADARVRQREGDPPLRASHVTQSACCCLATSWRSRSRQLRDRQ
uniref:Dynein_attach_N domain-containing protein n=1 Tax=Macrostomum lignano TaxID=282301 RepID=A0A1I8F8G8_9PLAT